MNAHAPGAWPRVADIGFDRQKYGRELLVDACAIGDIPGFITGPRAHRLGFYEIALVVDGRGRLEVDGEALAVEPRRVLLTAPGEVRRWRLDDGSPTRLAGMLAFFEADFINGFFGDPRFLESLSLVAAPPARRSLGVAPKAFDTLLDIVGSMRDELRDVRGDSSHALRAQTYRLLVALQRLGGTDPAAPVDPARALARRFAGLVDAEFARQAGVAHYAERLGVTTRHLNRCVRLATGRTASETIHARLLLEARRLLLHTDLGVAAIAERLNFSDASYFVRFFKRGAATTPRRFRMRGS